jgi:hypothetical protein
MDRVKIHPISLQARPKSRTSTSYATKRTIFSCRSEAGLLLSHVRRFKRGLRLEKRRCPALPWHRPGHLVPEMRNSDHLLSF